MVGRITVCVCVYYCLLLIAAKACSSCNTQPALDPADEDSFYSKLKVARIKAIQEEILSQLGMRRRPNLHNVNVSAEERQKMLRMYEESVKESRRAHRDLFPESGLYAKTFFSFRNSGKPVNTSDDDWLSGNIQRFYFKTEVPSLNKPGWQQRVASAKLKLYKTRVKPENAEGATIRLDLYMRRAPTRSGERASGRLLLESRFVSLLEPGWEVFDISQTVQTWMNTPQLNFGIEIECVGQEALHHYLTFVTEDDPVIGNRIFGRLYDFQPLVNTMIEEYPLSTRSRRNTNMDLSLPEEEDCLPGDGESRCCRFPLRISFKELGWDDWIIEPDGYEAYYCNGSCPHRYRAAHSHALIKSSMNIYNPDASPRPCCTPKVLSPLLVLHHDESDPPRLVVKKLNDMTVEQCACS